SAVIVWNQRCAAATPKTASAMTATTPRPHSSTMTVRRLGLFTDALPPVAALRMGALCRDIGRRDEGVIVVADSRCLRPARARRQPHRDRRHDAGRRDAGQQIPYDLAHTARRAWQQHAEVRRAELLDVGVGGD